MVFSLITVVPFLFQLYTLSLLTAVPLVGIVSLMKAQFEVDEVLWRKIRVRSLESGRSIGELVEPVLRREFGGEGGVVGVRSGKKGQVPVESVSLGLPVSTKVQEEVQPHHQCAICKVTFLEVSMVYHSKTMKWACKECAENQKNGQV